MKQFAASLGIGLLILLISVTKVMASEGTFELRNRIGTEAICKAYSVQMQDLNFDINVSCRDITYPGGTQVVNYVAWATPLQGGNPFRLGTIDLGKVQFRTLTPFSSMFVTVETDAWTRTPSNNVIMSGAHERDDFLDGSEPRQATDNESGELGEPIGTDSPQATTAPSRNIGRIFAIGGFIAFLAIFGVVLIIFVITRRK